MGSLRKPTDCVPKDMGHATAWDQAEVSFAPPRDQALRVRLLLRGAHRRHP
jgi:hypothetical protein